MGLTSARAASVFVDSNAQSCDQSSSGQIYSVNESRDMANGNTMSVQGNLTLSGNLTGYSEVIADRSENLTGPEDAGNISAFKATDSNTVTKKTDDDNN